MFVHLLLLERHDGITAVAARSTRGEKRATKRRKLHGGKASDIVGFKGPWAPMAEEEEWRKTALEKGTRTEEQKLNKAEWVVSTLMCINFHVVS